VVAVGQTLDGRQITLPRRAKGSMWQHPGGK